MVHVYLLPRGGADEPLGRNRFMRPIRLREGFCATFVCKRLRKLFATLTLRLRDYTFARTFERHVSA